MRGQVIDSIFEQMKLRSDVFFLTADMGINLVEKFGDTFPDRYLNVGIAEQNLIGISAGLANLGFRPFAYTISNFVIHRCFEQIRNDISLHKYPITILGTSTGFDNAPLGPTHHIIDEWGVLKSIPDIDIYCPSSVRYCSKLIDTILTAGRPAYVRIPKGSHLMPESEEHLVKINGKSEEILLVAYGNSVQNCLEVQRENPKISVLVVNRLRPIDEKILVQELAPHDQVFVIEDHLPNSGLYGTLCEVINRHPIKGRVRSLAPDGYSFDVGTTPEYFHRKYLLDAQSILNIIESSHSK